MERNTRVKDIILDVRRECGLERVVEITKTCLDLLLSLCKICEVKKGVSLGDCCDSTLAYIHPKLR
jgi:hypothetical protein